MIMPYDINPELSLYFIGAQIIQLMKSERMGVFDVGILYDKYTSNFQTKISYSYFLYALDWLYIIDLVKINQNNEIEICI